MINIQGYIGCTRVYRVYKGIQGVQEYTGCTRYTGYTRVYRVYKGIHGVLEYTGCTLFFQEGKSLSNGYLIILFIHFFH